MPELKRIVLFLLLCVVFSTTTHSRRKRVNVKPAVTIPERPRLTFIYSSSSKESATFISQQLLPTYKKLNRHMILELVPFANLSINQDKNGNYELNCPEEKQAECEANKVQGCVLGERGGTKGHLIFIECYMRTGTPKKYQKCAYKAKLNHLSIAKCLKSNGSMKNLNKMGKSIKYLDIGQTEQQNNVDNKTESTGELPNITKHPEAQVTELPVNKNDMNKIESFQATELPQNKNKQCLNKEDKGKEDIPNTSELPQAQIADISNKADTGKEEFRKASELDQDQIPDSVNKTDTDKEESQNVTELPQDQITDSSNTTDTDKEESQNVTELPQDQITDSSNTTGNATEDIQNSSKLDQIEVTELPSNKEEVTEMTPGKHDVTTDLNQNQINDSTVNNTDIDDEEFPNMNQLPVIIFNNNFSTSLQNEAKNNLFNVICKLRKFPPECKNVAGRNRRKHM